MGGRDFPETDHGPNDMNSPLVAYALLFTLVGVGFILVHLLIGRLVRPSKPGAEKKTIYECGEPTIGSAWIQFDLRFYVVALLFVIFDVEVAFFFPWAEVFGKNNALVARDMPTDLDSMKEYAGQALELMPANHPRRGLYRRLVEMTPEDYEAFKQVADDAQTPAVSPFQALRVHGAAASLTAEQRAALRTTGLPLSKREFETARESYGKWSWLALYEILLFFGILLVGFAYLWRRGDLQWVRSTLAERPAPEAVLEPTVEPESERQELAGSKT
jgi:NADH-quinone oxidoreductase subunit A